MNPLSIWQWRIMVLVMTVAKGFIAQRKGRSALGWTNFGMMFNPIAFVILPLLPSLRLPRS